MFFGRKLKSPPAEKKTNPIVRFIAGLCTVLGAVVLVLAVIGLIGFYKSQSDDENARPLPKSFTLFYDFSAPMADIYGQPTFFDELMGRDIDLTSFLKALDDAKNDPRVTGLAVNIHDGDYSLTQLQTIRKAVIDFKSTGKQTVAYSTAYGDFSNGLGEYWLATAFDTIWVQPVGLVSLNGIAIEQPYARDVLAKLGVQPEILQRKAYKTGPETYLRAGMSEEGKETLVDISQGMMEIVLNDIAKARNLPLADVAQAVNTSPLTDQDAYKFGLIDQIGYTSEVEAKLKADNVDNEFVPIQRYAYHVLKIKKSDAPRVAVVMIEGMIMDATMAAQSAQSLFVPSDIADAREIAGSIMNAADDENIKVILMRVNSPGGSPTASETIRHAVSYARTKGKYVIVSMGDVAASGGYWVSVNANQIIASDMTLTGSIGVYGGKMNLDGLWEKVGVNWDSVEVGQNASMWSLNTGYSEAELVRLNVMMDSIYDGFVTRVAEGRGMTKDKVEDVAQGRAWMGNKAKDVNLVDLIGGFDFALKRAAGEAGGLDWKTMPMIILPIQDDPFQGILDFIGIKADIPSKITLPKSLTPLMYQDAVVTAPVLDVQF